MQQEQLNNLTTNILAQGQPEIPVSYRDLCELPSPFMMSGSTMGLAYDRGRDPIGWLCDVMI